MGAHPLTLKGQPTEKCVVFARGSVLYGREAGDVRTWFAREAVEI